MLIIDNCNRCGKRINRYPNEPRHEVTCNHITFWEDDTKRYLCRKCYKQFQKYMEKNYNDFFTYLNKEEHNEN